MLMLTEAKKDRPLRCLPFSARWVQGAAIKHYLSTLHRCLAHVVCFASPRIGEVHRPVFHKYCTVCCAPSRSSSSCYVSPSHPHHARAIDRQTNSASTNSPTSDSSSPPSPVPVGWMPFLVFSFAVETRPDQTKSNQIKSNQIKSNQFARVEGIYYCTFSPKAGDPT